MDTKSKNESKPSKKAYILIFMAMIFMLSGFYCLSNISFIKENYYEDFTTDVCDISEINHEAVRYVKNLNRFFIYFKNFNSKTAYEKLKELQTKLTEEDKTHLLDSSFENENIDKHNYDDYDGYESEEMAEESEYAYFEKAPESYYNDIDYEKMSPLELFNIYKNLIDVYENYELVKNYLKNQNAFQYRLENKLTGEIFTNNDNIEKEEFYYKFPLDINMFNSEKFNGEFLTNSFEQNNLTGYIIVPKSIYGSKNHMYTVIEFNQMMKQITKYLNYLIPVLFLISVVIIGYIAVKEKDSAVKIIKRGYSKYRKLPFILKIILLFLVINFFDSYLYITLGFISPGMGYYNIITEFMYYGSEAIIAVIIFFIISMLFLILFGLSVIFIIDMLRKPSKLKDEYELSLIFDVFSDTKYLFNSKHYSLILLFIFLILGTAFSLFLFIMVMLYIGHFSFFHLFIIFSLEIIGLISVYAITKLIVTHCKLSYHIENIAAGKDEHISEKSNSFRKPFDDLEIINKDIHKKIEEMMKNERLKTELITNVSHDLKTPLTSIISYIDLLKGENLNNETAGEYISILDSKADKLKVLIENLFEASKLSSKQFKLDITKSDIIALLKQTLGEFNNKIEESDINFVIELPNNPIYLNIDGQQMWRVFDNLLGNIIKYSPKKSRAYISLEETETEVKIIMKNISKAPLNFDPDELFERFKRGDSSRTTDGSGLGLSIVKGIIEHHGGKIFIDIDGDLFKVAVILKKA